MKTTLATDVPLDPAWQTGGEFW